MEVDRWVEDEQEQEHRVNLDGMLQVADLGLERGIAS